MKQIVSFIHTAALSLLRDIYLLWTEPRNFLYILLHPTREKVRLIPHDPHVVRAGEELIAAIKKEVPQLSVLLVGSSSLGIAGDNDIDLLADFPRSQLRSILPALIRLLGKPQKVRRTYVDFRFMYQGYPVDFSIVDPSDWLYKERIAIFYALRDNKEKVKMYKMLKQRSIGVSRMEYKKRKLLFFHHIVTEYYKKEHRPVNPFALIRWYTIATIIVLLFTFVLFSALVKGVKGSPLYFQSHNDTRLEGPFESSNSTARYALTEAIVNNHTLFLSYPLAQFSSPDVVYYQGRFLSIFTPGISLIGVPFYLIGQLFGAPQLFTYLSTLLFAILNLFLIAKIGKKLTGNYLAGLIAGCIFTFATDALAYSLTFTQHELSTTIVLLALLNSFEKRNWENNISLGILFGAGLLADIPNGIFLLPIVLFVLAKQVHVEKLTDKIVSTVNLSFVWLIIGLIPLLVVFGWYNKVTEGSFTSLAQNIGRTTIFAQQTPSQPVPAIASEPAPFTFGVSLPFNTRLQLQGLYILLLSNERAWWYYCPILLAGILGFILLYRQKEKRSMALLIASIILVNIVLYSMFGDPWGGWAFGPRYLIPGAGLMSVLISAVIVRYRRNVVAMLIFGFLLVQSICISFYGALTTAAIPPKSEAQHLLTPIPYTYMYNLDLIRQNRLGSLVYNVFLSGKVSAATYVSACIVITCTLFVLLYVALLLQRSKEEAHD